MSSKVIWYKHKRYWTWYQYRIVTFWQELKTCKSGRGQRRFSIPWFPLSSWLGHLLHEFSSGEKGKQRKSQLQGELYKISQVSVFMVCFACAGFQATSLVNSINEGYQATINRSNVTESGSCVTTPSGFRRSSKAWVVASIHDYTSSYSTALIAAILQPSSRESCKSLFIHCLTTVSQG